MAAPPHLTGQFDWISYFDNGYIGWRAPNAFANPYTAQECAPFCDVPTDHSFYSEIKSIFEAAITEGCHRNADNRPFYCPERPATRGEAARMVARWLYDYQPQDWRDKLPPRLALINPVFTDLQHDGEVARAAELLHRDGIVSGYIVNGTREYRPNEPITRIDTVRILVRALLKHGSIGNPTDVFSDTDDLSVLKAAELGITQASLTFRPNDSATRAEMAAFVCRAFLQGEPCDPNNSELDTLRDAVRADRRANAICFTAAQGAPVPPVTITSDGQNTCYCFNRGEYALEVDGCPDLNSGSGIQGFIETIGRYGGHVFDYFAGLLPLGADLQLQGPAVANATAATAPNTYWIGTKNAGVIAYQIEAGPQAVTQYTTENSDLLSDEILDIAVDDRTGFVWVATKQGVSRFDGESWQNHQIGHQVNAIDISPAGTVWLGMNDGLARYDGSAWTVYTETNGLPFNVITALAVGPDGLVWFATANGIVVGNFNGNEWATIEGLPSLRVHAMTIAQNTVWFGTDDGLIRYEDGEFTTVDPQVSIRDVQQDDLSRIWVISRTGQVGVYLEDRWLIAISAEQFDPIWADICVPYEVTVDGSGMGTKNYSINPQTLDLPDPNSIGWLLAQVTGRYVEGSTTPDRVQFTADPSPAKLLTVPTANSPQSYTFETFIDPAAQLTAYVEHLTGNSHTPRGLVAYFTQPTSEGEEWTSVGRTLNEFVYYEGERDEHTEILAFPPLAAATDLHLTAVVADNEDDGRPIVVRASAGGVEAHVSLTRSSCGESLNIVNLTLDNVPAGTRHATISLESPSNHGESAMLVGVNVGYECLPPGARVKMTPSTTTMTLGQTRQLTVTVHPGPASVNGVTINGQVDPTYLELVEVRSTGVLSSLLAPAFDPDTGSFRYDGGVLSEALAESFDVLTLKVKAVGTTPGTTIDFLSDFPPTDISGPEGSVMDRADSGLVIINADQLQGSVDMQGRPEKPAGAWSIPLTLWLTPTGTISPIHVFSTTTDSYGNFVVDLSDIDAGNYDIALKGNHTLRNLAQNVNLVDDENRYTFGRLLEGDVETTSTFNSVEQADFNAFSPAFNTCAGDGSFLANADLDENGCVLIPDFGLLSGNFGSRGDVIVSATPGLPGETALRANQQGALLSFGTAFQPVEADQLIELPLLVEPRDAMVNGAAVEIGFDPSRVEVVQVALTDKLPFVLQAPVIDNQQGVIRLAAGAIGQTVTESFTLATISVKLKADPAGTKLVLNKISGTTDISGPTGSVLGQTVDLTFSVANNNLFLPLITH